MEYCTIIIPTKEIMMRRIELINPPENEPVVILPRNKPASHA